MPYYKSFVTYQRSDMYDRRMRADIRCGILIHRMIAEYDAQSFLGLKELVTGMRIVDKQRYCFKVVKISPKSVVIQPIQVDGETPIGGPYRLYEKYFVDTFRPFPSEAMTKRSEQLSRRRKFISNFGKESNNA